MFNLRSLLSHQDDTLSKSPLTVVVSLSIHEMNNKYSYHSILLQLQRTAGRSFMKRLKRRCPRIEPCGIPIRNSLTKNNPLPTITQVIPKPQQCIPLKLVSFSINKGCHIESKPLDRSINTAPTTSFLSKLSLQSSIVFSKMS